MKRFTSDVRDSNMHDNNNARIADITRKNDLANGSECDGDGSPGLTSNGAID